MSESKLAVSDIIESLKSYQGILRKKHSGFFSKLVGEFFGEDAGFMTLQNYEIVLTSDGIWEKVVETDLEWAGLVSILVNAHDIYAMGARPLMAANVISAKNFESLKKIVSGMERALNIFGIKMVKGHFHPDSSYNSVDVAMVGVGKRGKLLRSNTAKIGDEIVIGVDTDGKFHSKLPFNFDSTSKPKKRFVRQFESMIYLAENGLANSAKDLSNAGILGTVAMLLEVSRVGGIVDLEKIPIPENADLLQWLKSYPACGFVCTSENGSKVVKVFEDHGLSASVVGRVNDSQSFVLKFKNENAVFFDFKTESILGLSEKGGNQK